MNWSPVYVIATENTPILGVGVTPTHDDFVAIRRRDVACFSINIPTL